MGLQRIGHNLATEQQQQLLQDQPLNQAIARDETNFLIKTIISRNNSFSDNPHPPTMKIIFSSVRFQYFLTQLMKKYQTHLLVKCEIYINNTWLMLQKNIKQAEH